MNTFLHELCKLAGFDEPIRITYYRGNERFDEIKPKYKVIGTHTGRRSFICNALGMGISPQVVMKWTGHNDYKAMKPYIDVCDDIKEEAMKKFDNF
jgi:integrase